MLFTVDEDWRLALLKRWRLASLAVGMPEQSEDEQKVEQRVGTLRPVFGFLCVERMV